MGAVTAMELTLLSVRHITKKLISVLLSEDGLNSLYASVQRPYVVEPQREVSAWAMGNARNQQRPTKATHERREGRKKFMDGGVQPAR